LLASEGVVRATNLLALGIKTPLVVTGILFVSLGTALPELVFGVKAVSLGHKKNGFE
jgi:Ca2+/Na+ antiporter